MVFQPESLASDRPTRSENPVSPDRPLMSSRTEKPVPGLHKPVFGEIILVSSHLHRDCAGPWPSGLVPRSAGSAPIQRRCSSLFAIQHWE
jgi:hypothetical protein